MGRLVKQECQKKHKIIVHFEDKKITYLGLFLYFLHLLLVHNGLN